MSPAGPGPAGPGPAGPTGWRAGGGWRGGDLTAWRGGAGLVALAALAACFPWIVGSGQLFFWTTAVIAVLFATSVNLLFGVAGIPSFGQAAFYGAGGYAVAVVAAHGWPAPLALLAGVAAAGLVAAITSVITWRTTGLAFAMLTLAIAQAMYTLVVDTNSLGGYNGLAGVSAPPLGPFNLSDPLTFWYFTLVCVGIGLAALWQVGRSPFGQILRSVRENPVRATYLGVNVRAHRAAAFVIAGCLAGLAGGLAAYANQIVAPSSLDWTYSAMPIIMLLLGGRAYFWGPAVGAVILSWLLNYLSGVTTSYLLYIGVLLLAVLVLLPDGLLSLPGTAHRLRGWRRGGGRPAPPRPGAPRPAVSRAATREGP